MEPDCSIATGHDGRVTFTCPEEQCGAFDDMPCYFATVEQWIVHWNTFHVAIALVITCVVAGRPAKFNSGPDTVDAFFRHVVNRQKNLCDVGKWSRLNSLIRSCISHRPNSCYWPPHPGNGSHLRPNQVNSLMAEEMQDLFLAVRWVARTNFLSIVHRERPTAKKSDKA